MLYTQFACLKLLGIILLLTSKVYAVSVNPLPAPRKINWGGDINSPIHINPQLSLKLTNRKDSHGSQVILFQEAFQRMVKTIKNLKWSPVFVEKPISSFEPYPTTSSVLKSKRGANLAVSKVIATIDDLDAEFQLGVNETYLLEISRSSDGIQISAGTIWGALHALLTLQQLIIYENGAYIVEDSVEVWDEPLYQHRGVMIDSGRNFLSISSICDQIDIMSLSKLNVLHWHLADSQSWPIEILSYPVMIKDAYSPKEVYTQEDIKYVVNYAKNRGVRVIPEIDMPGHSRAGWRKVDPNIVSCANSWWSNDVWSEHTAVEPPPGQLDILYNKTYDIVKNVYDELSSLFGDNIFHVGADELQSNCYKFSSSIQNWLDEDSSRTIKDVTQLWVDKSLPIFNNTKNRRLMMWEDIILTAEGAFSLPKDVILQSWNNDLVNIKNLTSRGYDVVVSSSTHFYLDCGYGGFVTNDPRYVDSSSNDDFNEGLGGSWCAPYKTWQRIYSYDFTANLTEEEKSHVIGAEVALWSEQVDSTVLTIKTWPRLAAFAEMMWSGNTNSDGYLRTNDLTQRILNYREYIVSLGYAASPLVPKFCGQNPHACDLYKNQTIMDMYGQQ
ncbi:uncharacterized protein PRCAT00000010001 [Priceomyces carsonii]|uniref:uncharacterized protein n=1 Tax=Priceomyces carsonii TaxID=28549 RepID=UPI002ED9C83E|nr:unnamed protein product [Priceomyces carsonii]